MLLGNAERAGETRNEGRVRERDAIFILDHLLVPIALEQSSSFASIDASFCIRPMQEDFPKILTDVQPIDPACDE